MKSLVIIDCFLQSKSLEVKLLNRIKNLYDSNQDILLISNTLVDNNILKYVKYFIYDSENHLFSEKLKADPITLFKSSDKIDIHEMVTGVQRHGLSVIRNIFKSLKIAKEYGYTHFHRIEADDLMGKISIENFCHIPKIIESENLDGLFFFEEDQLFFHYMYCSIDYFLNNINYIDTEDDYYNYIINKMNKFTFKNVEVYLRHNLINSDLSKIKILDVNEIDKFFPDTEWNTELSKSNIDLKFKDCTTRLYKVYSNDIELDLYAILSYNYKDSETKRKIKVFFNSDFINEITHTLDIKGNWRYTLIEKQNVNKIVIYENDEELFYETIENVNSFIILK